MKRKLNSIGIFALGFALIASSRFSAATYAESLIKEGDVIAICGDSITEQKQYTVFIEDYLQMCQPAKVKVVQFGWSGETAQGFLGRMVTDVLPIKPTLATTCYGMNDGRYTAVDEGIRKAYRDPLTQIVKNFTDAGTKVIVGSPGFVDYATFKRANTSPEIYNANLATLRDEAKQIAEASGQTFGNVYDPMMSTALTAKAELGMAYHIGGGDGVHPSANGHLVMAYAFLKAMNFDGDLGTITVDLAGKPSATGGHKIASGDASSVTLQSTTYPFCFGGDPKNPGATTGITKYFPFNQDLNRLTLKVVGANGPKYKVTWGEASREYTGAELTAGVNLAADFIQNPFSEPFNVVERAIKEKQNFETGYFKNIIRTVNQYRAQIKDDAAVDAFLAACNKRHAELTQAIVDAKKPVTHTIKVEAVQ